MIFSPYTTILAKSWLHAMRVVSSTLHVKEKHPTDKGGGRVGGMPVGG